MGWSVEGLWWRLAKCGGGGEGVIMRWHVIWRGKGRWVLGLVSFRWRLCPCPITMSPVSCLRLLDSSGFVDALSYAV